MEKKKELITENVSEKPRKLKFVIKKIIYVLIIVSAGYALWKNPQIIYESGDYIKSLSFSDKREEEKLRFANMEQQIANLQNQIKMVDSKTAQNRDFDNRFNQIEELNSNVINSKADASIVLGMVGRLDNLEARVNNLAKITDEGALILTAVMLVKESADNGYDFNYEAEVLKKLAENNPSLNQPVEVILAYANDGVPSKMYLINQFESIYNALLKEDDKKIEAQNWKERIASKFNEFVKVKKVNDVRVVKQSSEDLIIANSFIKNGNIAKALSVLEKSSNPEIVDNTVWKMWIEEAESKVDFDKAVNKISAFSLAVMKVNLVKKEINND